MRPGTVIWYNSSATAVRQAISIAKIEDLVLLRLANLNALKANIARINTL